MVRHLLEKVPGQHVGLQTNGAQSLYESLGFRSPIMFGRFKVT
jgi:hypothetical protein